MSNTTETVAKLREFVADQAADDALMPLDDRVHQKEVVRKVLAEEVENPKLLKELFGSYSDQVTLQRQ